jgi:hypothetical protein
MKAAVKSISSDSFFYIDSDEEDNALKTIITIIQYGLLEKSFNKQSKDFVFDTIEECNHYRIKYGRKMNYREDLISNTVCEDNKDNSVDLLDEGIRFDDED